MNTNIVNDRGIHICKSMLAWLKWGNGETPETSGKKGDHLIGDYYVAFDKHYREGLPFHQGFLNIFDHAGNAFVSAYREYTNDAHTEVGIHVEYLATPSVDGKVLIIADPMLATGGSMELGYEAFLTKGTPKHIHVACVIATPEGIDHIKNTFPDEKTTIWCAAIDLGLNEHKYIVPGFGDAGDLCYGGKI